MRVDIIKQKTRTVQSMIFRSVGATCAKRQVCGSRPQRGIAKTCRRRMRILRTALKRFFHGHSTYRPEWDIPSQVQILDLSILCNPTSIWPEITIPINLEIQMPHRNPLKLEKHLKRVEEATKREVEMQSRMIESIVNLQSQAIQ